jgi:hypothetical protein
VVRENAPATTPRTLIENFHRTLDALNKTSTTFRTPLPLLQTLETTVPLGGEVTGERAGDRPEYGLEQQITTLGPPPREETWATEV